MPRRTVQQVFEGEWIKFDRADRIICCDCSLVHEMEYRIRDGKLELKMYRNNRSTAAHRRAQGLKLVVNKNGNHRNTRSGKRQ